jgi:hypothetical protein
MITIVKIDITERQFAKFPHPVILISKNILMKIRIVNVYGI